MARARTQAQLRRGMFLLPSLFTAVNIAAGYFSITETIKATSGTGNALLHLDWAAIAIIFAIPFDALDGRIARMTNTCSDFGKELDSLADAITFGVAPSLLLSAGSRAWPASTSATMPSRAIRDGRGASISSGCRYRPRQACWPLRFISFTAYPLRTGGSPFHGLFSWA